MGVATATETAVSPSAYHQKEQAFLDANDLSKYVSSYVYSLISLSRSLPFLFLSVHLSRELKHLFDVYLYMLG